MTSGNFKTVSLSSITVNRPERQRRELTDIRELAESIRTVGLINPPVVDDNLVLIAGERRLTACRDHLGWTSIPVQFASSLDPAELHLIELEENVKRVDLPWQDACRAIEQYHSMRTQLDPEWTANQTSRALGITPAEVSNRRMVAQALTDGDKLVVGADKYSVALGVVRRKSERAKASASDSISAMLPGAAPTPELATVDVGELLDETSPSLPEIAVPFRHLDFTEFTISYSGPKFNFIHCDFPYGVNADKHNQGAASAFGGYSDSPDIYWTLLEYLAETMHSIVADSAHMMFWFSMDYYVETQARLQAMGWTVNPFPLIWHKSDNSGILPDPKRGPRRIYETAFLCSRGDRLIVQAVSNVFSAPNLKTIHMSEKNPDMLSHFFRMFIDEHSRVLDPTMGSGNAIRVAEAMGAQYVLGLERDREFFETARDAYVAAKEV